MLTPRDSIECIRRKPQEAADWGPSHSDVSWTPLTTHTSRLSEELQSPEALERLFRGLGEVCSFSTERKRRWATQRPLRGPFLPDAPSGGSNPRAATLGPQMKVSKNVCMHASMHACMFYVCRVAADVWQKDVWDFHAFSQTFFELRLSLANEGKRART